MQRKSKEKSGKIKLNCRFLSKFIVMPLFVFLLISFNVHADEGLGGVANTLMEPVGVVSDFVNSACLILGVAFIFASIVKYFEHRRSPLMVTMSTVVFLFLAGFVLVLLPILSFISSGGIPYTLIKFR